MTDKTIYCQLPSYLINSNVLISFANNTIKHLFNIEN